MSVWLEIESFSKIFFLMKFIFFYFWKVIFSFLILEIASNILEINIFILFVFIANN